MLIENNAPVARPHDTPNHRPQPEPDDKPFEEPRDTFVSQDDDDDIGIYSRPTWAAATSPSSNPEIGNEPAEAANNAALVRVAAAILQKLGLQSQPGAPQTQRPPSDNPHLSRDVQRALDSFKDSPQFKLDPSLVPELANKLTDFLRTDPRFANDPAAAQTFLENMQRGVLGLKQPLAEFAADIREAYARNGIDITQNPERLVLDSSATKGAPSRPEKGSTFRPADDPTAPKDAQRASDLDVAYRSTEMEFEALANRRMAEQQKELAPIEKRPGVPGKAPGADPKIPLMYELRMPDSKLPPDAIVREKGGKRLLQLRNIHDLQAARLDSDAYTHLPENFAKYYEPDGTPKDNVAHPLTRHGRELAAGYQDGLLRADMLPGKEGPYRPPDQVRKGELADLSRAAGRDVSFSVVREGGKWDPERAGREAYRLTPKRIEAPIEPLKPLPAEPGALTRAGDKGLAIAGIPMGGVQFLQGVRELSEGHTSSGLLNMILGTANTGGSLALLKGSKLAGPSVLGATVTIDGIRNLAGAVVDVRENGFTVDNTVRAGEGTAQTIAGGAMMYGALGGSAVASGVVAPIAFGTAAILDGARNLREAGLTVDTSGLHVDDPEKGAIGGAKILGGSLMLASGVVAATGVGAPIAAGLAVAGGIVYAGAAVYENREAIAETVSNAVTNVWSLLAA